MFTISSFGEELELNVGVETTMLSSLRPRLADVHPLDFDLFVRLFVALEALEVPGRFEDIKFLQF